MSETDPLIDGDGVQDNAEHASDAQSEVPSISQSPLRWLIPLSFLTACACTATSATSVFAFAQLLCRDPPKCDHQDSIRFAVAIAVATSSANVLGALALFPLRRLSRRGPRTGLLIWLLLRFLSPVCLLAGVLKKNIWVALCSRIFESIASDNVFHFNQNAAFSQTDSQLLRDRLMAASLAAFMVGVSISPFAGGLLQNIRWSFMLSICLFVCASVHVLVFIKNPAVPTPEGEPLQQPGCKQVQIFRQINRVFRHLLHTVAETMQPIVFRRKSILIGGSLFAYNAGQSYAFESMLVSNTLHFGFGALENGIIISSAHAASALSLLTLTVLTGGQRRKINTLMYGVVSLAVYGAIIIWLGLATSVAEVYTASVFIAIGLAASFFLKAELISSVPREAGPSAAAFAASMEILASTVAPVIIGHLQAYWDPQKSLGLLGTVMFVSAGLLLLSKTL